MNRTVSAAIIVTALVAFAHEAVAAQGDTVRLESRSLRVQIDPKTGKWSLLDKNSGVRWPSAGTASPGSAEGLASDFQKVAT